MGREVRMIKPGWEHPRYPADHYERHLRCRYIPLLKYDFDQADAEWTEGWQRWQQGLCRDYSSEKWVPIGPDCAGVRYTEYSGPRPSPDDYMPKWAEGEATFYVMYEDTSEGTPISPPFETPEALARWLADNNASAFADNGASYEQWLSMIGVGWAPSAVLSSAGMKSGVAALAEGTEAAQVVG